MSVPNTQTPPIALVVDDDAAIRMVAVGFLEDAGYEALEAETGDRAVALLEQHHRAVQVLFTDVQMPGSQLDGFALARHTATHWPHIAIVVASGAATPGPDDLPAEATFLRKPFSAEVVHDHLRMMLAEEAQPEPLRQ